MKTARLSPAMLAESFNKVQMELLKLPFCTRSARSTEQLYEARAIVFGDIPIADIKEESDLAMRSSIDKAFEASA